MDPGPSNSESPDIGNIKKKNNRRRPKRRVTPTSVVDDAEESAPFGESSADNSYKRKRVRVRRKPNLQQFVLENSNEGAFTVINSNLKHVKSTSKTHLKSINDDILQMQSLYFGMSKLTVQQQHKTEQNTPVKRADKKDKTYEPFLDRKEVVEGLKTGKFFEGSLRINSKCYQQAYISHPNKKLNDILITGVANRNRALEDDVVVVKLKESEDEEGENKVYGKVVYIKEHVHNQISTGTLKLVENNTNQQGATFFPRDKRFPNLFIPLIDCPHNFQIEHKQYENTLFSARIIKWVHPKQTIGTLMTNIGQSNDLKAQTEAILIENDLNYPPYGNQYQHLYPAIDFVIPDEEILKREDFRNICVFTIDPATARDLDDAISCKKLDNGNYELGVHISDVTYYLDEGTALDKEVSKRATTVYLVDGTYHMLPKDLCLHCSLLPGTDKLTFSVIWEITPLGEIVGHRFTKGIVNSCCQLAYEHVQYMIDNPDKELIEQDYPKILGQWSLKGVRDIVDIYHKYAVQLRTKRFEGGALRIDQPKVLFHLDPFSGTPLTYKIEEHNESHRLIEEFMLLANCTVAERIYNDFPKLAFLRLHPPPKNTIEGVTENLSRLGIHLDVSSAGELHSSLAKHLSDDNRSKVFVLQTYLVKTLSRAKYFCVFGYDDEEIRHYALNAPLYTHFTSPIRRYADIVVHRLLSATLGYIPSPKWRPEDVQKIANNCNKQKYNAKKANDMSCELYLFKYISMYSPVQEKAAIMEILSNAIDIIVFSSGLTRRIYFDNFSDVETEIDIVQDVDLPQKAVVKWKMDPQIIQIFHVFDEVNVILEKTDNLLVITCRMESPSSVSAENSIQLN